MSVSVVGPVAEGIKVLGVVYLTFSGSPTGTIQKLQWAQSSACQIVLQASRYSRAKPLLLPVQQWITYKLTVLMYTSAVVYQHNGVGMQLNSTFVSQSTADSAVHLTDFSRRDFCFSSQSVKVAAKYCSHQPLSVCFLFTSRFHWSLIQPAASASEVATIMALYRFDYY